MKSLKITVGMKVCTGVGVQVGTLLHGSSAFYFNAKHYLGFLGKPTLIKMSQLCLIQIRS